MPVRAARFDSGSVRESWDIAADAYAEAQASGRDRYRYAFFGPAQVEQCGDVAGLRILDLGCGAGYFAREMARRGARVTALDIAARMVAHARRLEGEEPLGIEYHVLDAAEAAEWFEPASFDMATACLSLQDMPEVPRVVRGVFHLLRPGGRFVASTTHPCTDTPYRDWEKDEAGRKVALRIDRYFERVPIDYTWRAFGAYEFTTPSVHAPLEDWFAWILDAGFRLRAFREPAPSAQAVEAYPDLEDAARVPQFVIFDLEKPAA